MAMDAGTYMWTAPTNGQATDAANGGAITTGTTAFFVAQEGVDVVEVGLIVGNVAPPAGSLVMTAASGTFPGGTYTVQNTVTGPASPALTAGQTLRSKSCK